MPEAQGSASRSKEGELDPGGAVPDMPSLEVRIDDVRAVLEAVGSERAALFDYSEGGAMCALFAATHPERTAALVMAASFARRLAAHDHPWGWDESELGVFLAEVEQGWGEGFGLETRAPSRAGDAAFRGWWARSSVRAPAPPRL